MDYTLLEILACPLCKSKLNYDKDTQELICRVDHLAYPVRNEAPMMLPAEARAWSEE